MKRTDCRVLVITVATLLCLASSPLQAQPDKIVLDYSNVFTRKTRPEVSFPHIRHMEGDLSCKDCHHIYKNGENVLDEGQLEEGNQGIRCSACHVPKSRINLEEAFHNQCIGCHRTCLKKNKKTGPLYCGECHIRN